MDNIDKIVTDFLPFIKNIAMSDRKNCFAQIEKHVGGKRWTIILISLNSYIIQDV